MALRSNVTRWLDHLAVSVAKYLHLLLPCPRIEVIEVASLNTPSSKITISEAPAVPFAGFDLAEFGGEVCFRGVVRGLEDGRSIRGISYTGYLPMAEEVMKRLHSESLSEFGPHPFYFHHRLGFVAAGEASVVIALAMKHSPEAFSLCAHYLKRLKTELPIWKEPMFHAASL